jgi:DNA helicase IV
MHPDVPDEQAYFDRALDLRDRLEANLDRAATLAADPKTAAELRRRVGALGVVDPSQSVSFGRIDKGPDRWYIGRGAIWDEDNDLVVVNWQAPVAAPFYTATPDDPEGLDRRRIFRCRDNRILGIDEMVFNGIAKAVVEGRVPEPVLTDTLLESLGRERSGELADIVATIQAAQYDVIAREAEQLLIVQGGPGTGKTVVGLHRISWLLFNHREQLKAQDVLIVGPNPAFIRYLSGVLPALGEAAVVQMPVSELGPRVRVGVVDDADLRRLKGDRRMLRLLLRGLRNRERVALRPVELTVEGRRVQLDGDRLAGRARQLAGQPHNDARRELRSFVIDEVQRLLTHRGARDMAAFDIDVRGASAREVDNYLERVWPNLTPQSFVLELFSTRRQLEAAAAGLLTTEEIDLLTLPRDSNVSTWLWSVDDVPLLDLADVLLNGAPASYEHIVVDEAQDLSPMQFESIRRRSRTGYMTVLGDLAQATGPWGPASWEEVALHLRRDRVNTDLAELSLGYRLPSEVHEVAMRLLPEIAPRLNRPEPLRSSGYPVTATAVRPDDLAGGVVRAVREVLGSGLVGVITSDRDWPAITDALDAERLSWSPEVQPASDGSAPIVVLGPDGAKGLEFDNVIVVEPARIVAEWPEGAGMRALFVALTRPTRRLALVHAEPLPKQLGLESPLLGAASGATAAAAGPVAPGAPLDDGLVLPDDDPYGDERTDPLLLAGTNGASYGGSSNSSGRPGYTDITSHEDDTDPFGNEEAFGQGSTTRGGSGSSAGAGSGSGSGSGQRFLAAQASSPPSQPPPDVAPRPRPPGARQPAPTPPPAQAPAPASSPSLPAPVARRNDHDQRQRPQSHQPQQRQLAQPSPSSSSSGVVHPSGNIAHPPAIPAASHSTPPAQSTHTHQAQNVRPAAVNGAEPFAALDREMANAVASKLVEALARYATPALIPLVVEQMREILQIDAGPELSGRPSSAAPVLGPPAPRAGLPSPQEQPPH